MVFDQKKGTCSPHVRGEILPQVEELAYLAVLLTGEGRTEQKINRKIKEIATIMHLSVVLKRAEKKGKVLNVLVGLYSYPCLWS